MTGGAEHPLKIRWWLRFARGGAVDTAGGNISFRVLGPLAAERDGQPVQLGGLNKRVLLAMLLLNAGRVVSVERLVDGLWDEDPPSTAVNSLQVLVSQLRRALADGTGVAIVTRPPGYLLEPGPAQIDLAHFESLVSSAHQQVQEGRTQQAADSFDRALALWEGPPLADLGSGRFAESARSYLEERRLGALEDYLQVLLEIGRLPDAVRVCSESLASNPLRESLWEKLMLALYRSGRQAEALAQYRRCRHLLLDQLGVEPMPRLQQLEQQMLNHDETLLSDRSAGTTTVAPARKVGAETVALAQRLDAMVTLADGTSVPLSDRVVLGRDEDCDIVLTDEAVSRRHAEIRLASGRHILLDLSSSNGTWVKGEPVLQHLLHDGDAFQVGGQVLVYRTG
jgi:SARP family transcriptional regulator, regulator of embCAB operon